MAANQLAAAGRLSDWRRDVLPILPPAQRRSFPHPDVEFLLLNVAELDALKLDATALIADARTGLRRP